ncbi:hypothetical protein RRG08_053038 [Elysia crispata]|uniref:C-type lectin domain-containing protein n=1 Tax=Elysia crispata TaxID=231223 RepID=A0AAE0Z747_9GAST|nr:hypothetical protein RRG08_053038 [Elysia crispata]
MVGDWCIGHNSPFTGSNMVGVWNEIDGVWLGGSDIFSEGSWEWVGSKIPITEYTDWGPNGPNSIASNGREDCLSMWKDMAWSWNDEACVTTNVLYFLCQTRSGLYEDIIG